MNKRFSTGHVLIFVIVMNTAFISPARSENSTRDDLCEVLNECELTWVEKKLKALKDFADKIDENIARFKQMQDDLSRGKKPVDPAESSAEELDPLPRVSIEKSREQLQKDLLDSLISAHRQQNNLVWDTERALKAYVSTDVEKCKKLIAAGDEPGARASCGKAQAVIEQCRARVEPEINQRAERLTAKYKEIYRGADVNTRFSHIHCDLVFSNIEDPGKLLRIASMQLPDSSCYAHMEEVKKLARTGLKPIQLNALLKGNVDVPTYLSFIEHKCPERISRLARAEVEEILKAKEEERRRQNKNETAVLERGGGSGAMLQDAIRQAEQEDKDRPAREAREREAQARAAEEERIAKAKAAAEARAFEQEQARKREQKSRETREALGQLFGLIGQIQQSKADRKQAQYEEQQRLLKAQQEQQKPAYQGGSSSGSGAGGCVPGTQSVTPCNGTCGPGLSLRRYYVYKDRTKYDLRCIREN